MIFLCPFLHCEALITAMYKCYINSIIIIIIINKKKNIRQLYQTVSTVYFILNLSTLRLEETAEIQARPI